MKNKDTDKDGRKQAIDKALGQLRSTRAKIAGDHPGLFENILSRISPETAAALVKKPLPKTPKKPNDETVKVNRHKNLEAVAKFLEMKNKNKSGDFKARLEEILKDIK